jgi:beta-glucanase (GH16 family)
MHSKNFMMSMRTCALFGGIMFFQAQGAATDTAWGLVWTDECNGAAGTAVDGTKWNFVNSAGGFGNGELQYYTNRTANSYYDGNGNLVIKTVKESYSGSNYTSAKLYSRNKGDWTYCKADIRARLPKGRCVWPAFWMMPTSSAYGGWPVCGEIDIMEERGDQPNRIGSTIHFGNPWKYIGASYQLPSGQNFDTAYHNFGMEWEAGTFRFYVDNILFETRLTSEWYCSGANESTNPNAPFDQNFYMQLNTAVGGPNTPYTGRQSPDDAVFPQYMYIDYVRIYKRGAPVGVTRPAVSSSYRGMGLMVSTTGFRTARTQLHIASGASITSLSIYNMRGELLRSLDVDMQKGNQARVVWDGKNRSGTIMGSGTYAVAAMRGAEACASGLIVLGR